MKEYVEFRILYDYAHLLFGENEGINIDDTVKVIRIETCDPRFRRIGELEKMMQRKGDFFFSHFSYNRKYTREEINDAALFRVTPFAFTVAGEECGTRYDEATACPICGAGAKMTTPLRIRAGRIPKKDICISMGWGEEVIVSQRFRQLMEDNSMRGMRYEPVYSGKKETGYFHLIPEYKLNISPLTKFGANPFMDLPAEEHTWPYPTYKPNGSIQDPGVYKCPKGDSLGLNILSEAYVEAHSLLNDVDFFVSKQTYGGRIGLFRPTHLLFCSNRMMRLIKENKLKGFEFEVAHIVEDTHED